MHLFLNILYITRIKEIATNRVSHKIKKGLNATFICDIDKKLHFSVFILHQKRKLAFACKNFDDVTLLFWNNRG